MALEIDAPGHAPIIFETSGDGDIVGASWLIPPYRWVFDARAVELTRAIGIDAACLRGKCEADHRSRLRDDEAISAGAGAAAPRNPAADARCLWPALTTAELRPADPFVPQIYRVDRVSRELADTVTLDLDSVVGFAAAVRAGAIQHALCLRRWRSSDQHERRPRARRLRAHRPRCRCRQWRDRQTRRRARSSDCAGHSERAGRSRRPRDPTSSSLPAASALRRCAPRSTKSSPTAAATAASSYCLAVAIPRKCSIATNLKQWRRRLEIDIEVTVDHADADWRGNVGVVPALIPRAAFDPHEAVALVCGPEVMMRFTVNALRDAG